jgi:hypothetical protein
MSLATRRRTRTVKDDPRELPNHLECAALVLLGRRPVAKVMEILEISRDTCYRWTRYVLESDQPVCRELVARAAKTHHGRRRLARLAGPSPN